MLSVYAAECFIHHLCVAADRRSRGVGAQLLNSLITLLPYPWRLKCVAANTRALLFYEKLHMSWWPTPFFDRQAFHLGGISHRPLCM